VRVPRRSILLIDINIVLVERRSFLFTDNNFMCVAWRIFLFMNNNLLHGFRPTGYRVSDIIMFATPEPQGYQRAGAKGIFCMFIKYVRQTTDRCQTYSSCFHRFKYLLNEHLNVVRARIRNTYRLLGETFSTTMFNHNVSVLVWTRLYGHVRVYICLITIRA